MSTDGNGGSVRRHALLAGKVLGDLSADELRELEECAEPSDDALQEELELVAARVQLALESDWRSIPPGLSEKIVQAAAPYVAANNVAESRVVTSAALPQAGASTRKPGGFPLRERIAWIACAASILLLVGALWTMNGGAGSDENSLALLAKNVDTAKDKVSIEWSPGKHPPDGEVGGRVVWSNALQAGYMQFEGLPVNDPAVSQYQLWIIDPDRDDEPVDGGVFDIREDQDIVPINAKLRVLNPAAFAITVEKPGGVVVSNQENLPLIAPVPSEAS